MTPILLQSIFHLIIFFLDIAAIRIILDISLTRKCRMRLVSNEHMMALTFPDMRDLRLADLPFLREFRPRLRFGSGHAGLFLHLFLVHEHLFLMLLLCLLHYVGYLLFGPLPLPHACIDLVLPVLDPLVPQPEERLESLLDAPEELVLAHEDLPHLLLP